MSLLAWWVEAGVDVAVQDEPRDWRKRAAPSACQGRAASWPPSVRTRSLIRAGTAPATAADRAPGDLDAFHAWLAESADLPLFRAGAARALPHGPASAEIMLLTGIPAPEDTAEGKPIGGAAWMLGGTDAARGRDCCPSRPMSRR
jgi:hypothetical protein